MKGSFFFAALPNLSFTTKVSLRSSSRSLSKPLYVADSEAAMTASIKVFQEGEILFEEDKFCSIGTDQSFEFDDQKFVSLVDEAHPYMIRLICSKGNSNENTYFPQEHQISYFSKNNDASAYLLYDQLPLLVEGKAPSPVVLMAPKAMISKTVDTHLIVASSNNICDSREKNAKFWIAIVDQKGNLIAERSYHFWKNSASSISIRDFIAGKVDISQDIALFNVLGKGGNSSFSIYSIVESTQPYSLGIEHSLPPFYFSSGNINVVRGQALSNYSGALSL